MPLLQADRASSAEGRAPILSRGTGLQKIALKAVAAGCLGQGEFLGRFTPSATMPTFWCGDLRQRRNENLRDLIVGKAADIGAVDLELPMGNVSNS
jgi:hypothetical protein